MKRSIFHLLFLLPVLLTAQSISITQDDDNYYLSTVEISDNGTGIDDTIKTIRYLGDASTFAQVIRDIDAQNDNAYIRQLTRLLEQNYRQYDNELTNAAEEFGVNLDSINDEVYADDLMIDTGRIIVFLNRMSDDDKLLWTLDIDPPNKLVFDAYVERRPNRTLRLNVLDVSLASNQRVRMEGRRHFKVNNLPGASEFYLERETERSRIYRSIELDAPTIKIVLPKVPSVQSRELGKE